MAIVRENVSPNRVYTFNIFLVIHDVDFQGTSRRYAPKMVAFVIIAARATNPHVGVERYVDSCFRCRSV
jgi:hypothetical protein